ncbi:hypothetical protein NEAUS03_1225 [Nematocida ausubeli]|nr:hypothetical protein NEAUS03_1225 [Nematocida ausubeli]
MSSRLSYAKCKSILFGALKGSDADAVKAFRVIYGVLVMCKICGYDGLVDDAVSGLVDIYMKRRGDGLFVAGEFMEKLKERLQDTVIDSDKEYLVKVLGAKIERVPRKQVETKEFEEREPALKRSDGLVRGGKGGQKRKVKDARSKAKLESAEYIRRKRREDQEYSERLKRMEEAIKKQ